MSTADAAPASVSPRNADKPCIVITYPYPVGQRAAGGPRTLREVAFQLTAQGADVIVISVSTNALTRRFPRKPMEHKYLGEEWDAVFAAHGVELIRVPQDRWLYLWDGRPVLREMRRLLARRRVDLVLGHYHEAGYLPDFLAARGIPFGYFATWQTYAPLAAEPRSWAGRMQKSIRDRVIVEAHRKADIHFAISEFTKRELIEVLGVDPDRIVVAPLGVERSFLEIPRQRPQKIRNLLFFGRITWTKGFQDAFEALGQLRRQGVEDWHLRLIGECRPEMVEGQAKKFGVSDKITIDGPFDDAGLRRELREAHLAVLPSHAESFGHAIVEAQASGLAVVAYATGSVTEVVADGETGWLAPFRQREALATCLQQALSDPDRCYRRGLAARERVASLYQWEHTAAAMLEGLRDLKPESTEP